MSNEQTEATAPTQPEACSHCLTENIRLRDCGDLDPYWVCQLCEVTQSAADHCAGGRPDRVTQDAAALLWALEFGRAEAQRRADRKRNHPSNRNRITMGKSS